MTSQPVKRLQGAAARAAIAALDRNIGPAEQEVEQRTAELEAALISGRDTSEARQALSIAIKNRARIQDEREARWQQAEARKAAKITSAAQALCAAANASTSALLAGYAFELN